MIMDSVDLAIQNLYRDIMVIETLGSHQQSTLVKLSKLHSYVRTEWDGPSKNNMLIIVERLMDMVGTPDGLKSN